MSYKLSSLFNTLLANVDHCRVNSTDMRGEGMVVYNLDLVFLSSRSATFGSATLMTDI